MRNLLPVLKPADLPRTLRRTPFADLFAYQNFGAPHRVHDRACMLVGMCMDNRKQLAIPANFAFILRTGGGSLRQSEFKISFAVGVGGVRHLALIGHTRCGMVGLSRKRKVFLDGLVRNGGWHRFQAAEHFDQFAPFFEIGNEVDFVRSEAQRLRRRYPKVRIVPMIYRVEDNLLDLVKER
jgi:carbonic anhydrase